MHRKSGDKAMILTFNNKALINISESETKKQTDRLLRNLLEWLRSMAEKNNWSYEVAVCSSNTNPRTLHKVRLHIHLYITANPACTIEKAIRTYWTNKKKVGRVIAKTGYDRTGFIEYMRSQKICMKQQSYRPNETQLEFFNQIVKEQKDYIKPVKRLFSIHNNKKNSRKRTPYLFINITNNNTLVDRFLQISIKIPFRGT